MDGKTTTRDMRRLLETQLANYTKALERCGDGDRWYFEKRVDELRQQLSTMDQEEQQQEGP